MCKEFIYLISFVLALGLMGSVVQADAAVPEALLVDLRAGDLPYGEGVTTWPIAKWDAKTQ
jgi:hypothetical protein